MTEEDQKKAWNSQSLGQDSYPGSPEYKGRVLTTCLLRSVFIYYLSIHKTHAPQDYIM